MIVNWINRLRASRRWIRALDLAAKERFEAALAEVHSIENLALHQTHGTTEFDIHLQLLKAWLLIEVKKPRDAIPIIVRLDQLFGSGAQSPLREYLRGYISLLAQHVVHAVPADAGKPELSSLLKFDVTQINLDRVPKHIKQKFPLPTHPNWQS
jgi:hypothetical protein